MDDQLRQLSSTVLQGIQGGDRNVGSSNPAVNSFVQGLMGDLLAGSADVGGFAGTVADRQAAEAENARQAEIGRLQDEMDPSKFQVRRKSDGGFDFFDPQGNAISINDYADATGLRPVDILAKSENPLDMQYVNDYGNMGEVVEAIQNNDQATLQEFMRGNENIDPSSTATDMMQELIRRYPHIYGTGRYEDTMSASNNNPLFTFSTGISGGGGMGGGGGWQPS